MSKQDSIHSTACVEASSEPLPLDHVPPFTARPEGATKHLIQGIKAVIIYLFIKTLKGFYG